jgi:hypothetical protein
MTELVFLDPHTRALYADWDSKARAVVGNLRLAAGAHPDDPALASLIGKLILASPEFTTTWADHRVQSCATASYELHHPIVGTLTVTQQTLRSVERADQTIITCTAPPGSASAAALEILAHVAHQGARPTPAATLPAPDPEPASTNSGEPSTVKADGVNS